MIQRVIGMGVLKSLANKFMKGAAAEHLTVQEQQIPCLSELVDQNAQCEISNQNNLNAMGNQNGQRELDNLINEVTALELAVGQMIVARERYFKKPRLNTIAKRHLLKIKTMQNDNWVREARSLARYIATVRENDVATALEVLRPYVADHQVERPAVPNFNGRTIGAYEADKHLILRGNPLFTGEQHG